MEKSLQLLGIIRLALVASIIIYAFVAGMVGASEPRVPDVLLYALSFAALTTLATAMFLRQALVGKAEEVLRVNSEDVVALTRWRSGNIVFLALCEAVGIFGFVLRFLGFPMRVVGIFFAASIAMMFLFGPRRPA
jgi:F0F1-type ATP synthase membrane subunit c/vacuolar-type H+-ATPase subunit K